MIYLASDHAGFELKNALCRHLAASGREVEDMGPNAYDPEDDYPDFILPAAEAVAANPGSLGVVLGGSGQGEALAANKVMGVRAALYTAGPKISSRFRGPITCRISSAWVPGSSARQKPSRYWNSGCGPPWTLRTVTCGGSGRSGPMNSRGAAGRPKIHESPHGDAAWRESIGLNDYL